MALKNFVEKLRYHVYFTYLDSNACLVRTNETEKNIRDKKYRKLVKDSKRFLFLNIFYTYMLCQHVKICIFTI